MATKIQIKRTSVAGRTPNTADPANTSYITAGELAVNLTDKKLYSSNGTIAFEVGANLSSLSTQSISVGNSTVNTSINNSTIAVTTILANGSNGSNGQVLTSNGSAIFWGAAEAGAGIGNVSSSDTNILTMDSYNLSSYRTAKYLIQANTSDSFHSSEAFVMHDGTSAYLSEYGILYSNGSLFDLSADISGGELRLRVTPTRSGTTFKYKRNAIEV